MATEEEAREAADGQEVQVEAVDLEPFHMQTHLDSKLSSREIKNVAETIVSTEGTLKIPEDQVLVDAHSEIKLPLEHNLNGTSSSLNGHMDEENKISNEQLHEDSKKDHEQVEAALDGENTDQDNKINKEETITEDSSLLKHENEEGPKGDDQQDEDTMPDTLKTNSDIDETKLVVDLLDQNMDPAKAMEDIQPASMENIPNAEVVTEACAEVQSPPYPNLDDSDAILDTVDGRIETDEVAREHGAVHLEHREGFPEDTSTAKCTEEVAQAEDKQSKQADTMDADAVPEDIAKCVSEEMPKSEHVDESTIDAQEVLHQEPSEDPNGPACETKERTSQQSSMAASDDTTSEHDSTTCEPPVDIQVQNKKSLQEMKDADEVDTEAAMQESCITFAEMIPEHHVATTEHDSVETNDIENAETHNVKTVPSSEEDKGENGVTERGPTTGGQEVNNVESTEEIMDIIAENTADVTNVATVDEVDKEKNMLRAEDIAEKHMAVIESEVTNSTEPVETEEDSDQGHVSLLNDSAQGDNTPVSEKQDMESALEINEIEATRSEAVPEESNASVSEEPSPEDYVTESETTSDAKGVNTNESLEMIEGNKDTKTREMTDQDNMGSAEKSTQENNAPESELTSEKQPEQEPELKEMKVTELAQENGSSLEISASVFHKQIQENSPTTSELHVMEPEGDVRNIEATKVQATPHQLDSDHPEEKATEETITSSEPQTLEPESVEKMNDIEATKPQDISQQSIISPSEKSVPEEIAKEDIVTPDDAHQQPHDPDCCVQPAQQVESSKDSEDSKLLKEEGTSDQKIITLEDTATEDIVEDEIDPLVGMEQEHQQKSDEISDVQEVQELGPTEQTRGNEAKETVHHQQHRVSTLEEPAVDNKQNVDDHQVHKEKHAELKDNEAMEAEPVLEKSNISTPHNAPEEKIELGNDPDCCVQPAQQVESSRDSEHSKLLNEEETSDQNTITLDDTATEDIVVEDEIDTPVGMEQEHEQKSAETSNVQKVQELGPTEETIGNEATETEHHQQHRVSTLEEPAVDNKQNVADHQVHEEKPAELKDNEAMEAEPVLEKSNISSPDNTPDEKNELGNDPDCSVQPAQQVESSRDSEYSKVLKEEETSDQTTITLEDTATDDIVDKKIDTPVGMEQEHEQKSVDTSDVQKVQELGSTEQIRGNEATETEHHQQHRVSTLEEQAVDNKQNVDDHQVHEKKPAELKDNEPIEAEPVLEQGNISTPDNAPKEKAELGNDPDCCVQPAQQVELSRDSEDSKLLKEEETSDQTVITLENTATEDIVEDQIDTPVGMEQEREQESVETSGAQKVQELGPSPTEQTRGIKATESEDNQHRVSTLEEPAVDSKPNVDDHQVHEEKSAELKNNEAMEAQQVLEKINISTPDNVPGERSELGNDPDCCVQPAQQVESSRASEDSKLLKEEETSDQKIITLEDTATEGIVEDEINQPVGMKQEHEQKVSFDERHKEDEEVESQNEQLQADEQKHEDEDVDNEPLVESKSTETGTTNRIEGTDTLEAGPTEAVVNEILKIEQVLHNSEDSTPSITGNDYSANTSDTDAKMDKQEDQENTGKDNIVPMDSTSGQDETTDEITNEEDPIVPYNAESGGDEYKECTNKDNDDLLAIQEPEKEMVAGMQENKEMQNETKGVHHAESYPKVEEEEICQLHYDEPYNVDTKIDDTTHNTTVQPREIEEIEENKGLSSIYKPVAVVETSKQNNVEQDLNTHHKVESEKLESTEDNAVELEAMQEKVDTSNVNTNNDDQLSTINSFTKHETDSADGVLQLETEGNTCDKADETDSYEKTEASNTSVPETVTFNDETCDKVTGTEGGLSDESLKTFDDARRNLDFSSVVTESNEESINKEIEEHKFAAPAHPTMDENTPKQEISVSEKTLPTEPEEQEDNKIHKEQDEEGMHEPDFGDDQKEVEQDLPVSNFLMNLILGKENSDANGHSEPEAETKHEETTDDNICFIIHKQEESLVLPPTENNVEDKLIVEQEKKDVKCSEEKHEVVEEQSHDLMLGTETSLETDVEVNSHHLELPPYQDKMQDEISNEILSEEAAEVLTKVEAKDTVIPHIKQNDTKVDTVCQENTEMATQNEIGSLKNNLDDLNNTKTSEEETLGAGQTGLLPECLNDARSVNSVSEQTLLLTESGMTDAKSLPSEADGVPKPVCDIQDKTIESSVIGATSIPGIQLESEENKAEEKQHTTTATSEVAEEHLEISNDNSQKSIGPEATSNEQEPQIAMEANDNEITLGHEKGISAVSSSTFMDKKEYSNIPVKEGNNIQTPVEIQEGGSNMQINQDKQEAADNKTGMESEKLEEYIQEKQGNGTEEMSSKECHKEDQHFLVKTETVIKEGDVHETVKSHTETVKIEANGEQGLSDLKVQERGLNLFSPKDVREPEESFVDTAKPKFSTDEEQSPKADESNMSEQKTYEGKTKDGEKIENFTDKAMQNETQVAGQKAALKKHNLLSGVGSKVKRQLAKVKNAITGKPGHTKLESPKA